VDPERQRETQGAIGVVERPAEDLLDEPEAVLQGVVVDEQPPCAATAPLRVSRYEVAEGGVSVQGELYEVPDDVWQRVESGEPPGLYRGPVKLADGRVVPGILYPQEMAEAGRHRDISEFGGWREYAAAQEESATRP